MLIRWLEVIWGVGLSVGTFSLSGWFRFSEHIARFLFLGMRAMESREADHTVACISKNY